MKIAKKSLYTAVSEVMYELYADWNIKKLGNTERIP